MLSKREAIRECKRIWKEIEKSGLGKDDFLRSPAGKKCLDKQYRHDCPLCEYSGHNCVKCPLMTQYGHACYVLGFEDTKVSEPSFFEAVRGLKE